MLLIFIALLPLLHACSPNVRPEELTNEKAQQMIESEDVTVLDVRTEEEHAQGHLQDSILIPMSDLESRLEELDKDQAYLIVSQTGSQSSQAADLMKNNGFTEVYNLQSGISGWSYPLEK
ncbi:rhodanese-like domain-containing protein [Bacillus salacetis]|uniref:rhodanese-like domain-containing protein n=1 Tax=Bacillus salacetis TaxID=2315464 RepID=UPI003B9F6C32